MAKRMMRPKPKKVRVRLMCLAAAGVLSLLFYMLDARIRPMVQSMTEYQARMIAVMAINQAVMEELARSDLSYEDLISVSYDGEGNVTALESDMPRINQLKSRVTVRIQQELAALEQRTIRIPAGTLTGNALLAGHGPKLRFVMRPAGYVQTDMVHEFTDAGINQTKHQVMLAVRTRVSGFIPGYMASSEISTEFCISETVIVGKIPDAYTKVYDGGGELEDLIFHHRATVP